MCEWTPKNGETIEVSNDGKRWGERKFIGMHSNGIFVCEYDEIEYGYRFARPIPKKETRVKGLVALMQQLVDDGYEPNEDGVFFSAGGESVFYASMFSHCGNSPRKGRNYLPQWLEEVEVK